MQFLAGNYHATVAILEPALENHTADAGVLDLLAQANGMLSETERALTLLERAIAANPSASQYYADYAYICLAHGKFQAGLDVVNAGLKRLPDAAPLYVARGILRSELAQYEQGEEDFRRAAQLDPHLELGAAGRGLAELQRSDLPQAEATAREQLREQPNDGFARYLLAEILVRKGATPGRPEFAEAVAAAHDAVDPKPDFTLARNTLGQLYLHDGKIEPAIEQFQAALRVNPADEKALYHLILALRRSKQTAEVPALLKRLVAVRSQNRRQEDFGSQFGADGRAAEQAADAARGPAPK
ncbi:MAG: tetratricopeptide repeat protein [Acidobacteriota bacterium]|nr:tetratricopeptide repeat protein [Acidobacteriota bacterium]